LGLASFLQKARVNGALEILKEENLVQRSKKILATPYFSNLQNKPWNFLFSWKVSHNGKK
jgi:hypothetical protein